MTKSKEELAREYSESCDNESGSFLSRDLVKIRKKAHLAGYDARQAEVDELKSFIENVLLQTNKMTVQTLEIDKSWFYKNECIDLAKTIKNLRDEIQELKKFKELAKGPLDALNTYLWCVGVEKSRGKGVVSTKEALNDVAKAYYLFMDLVSKESKDGK